MDKSFFCNKNTDCNSNKLADVKHKEKNNCQNTKNCNCCNYVVNAPVVAGPRGPIGGPSGGPTGPTGATGGILSVVDFYALMPPDNAATVAPGTDVDFP